MAKTAFHRVAPNVDGPGELLTTIHRELVPIVPPGQFMTPWAALFDPAARTITMGSAGHPYPLKVHDDKVEVIRHPNEILMLVDPDLECTQQTTVSLAAGDRLLVYTDGAIEALEPGGNCVEISGLSRAVEEVLGEGLPEFLAALMLRLRQQARNRFDDDVALLCVESV